MMLIEISMYLLLVSPGENESAQLVAMIDMILLYRGSDFCLCDILLFITVNTII